MHRGGDRERFQDVVEGMTREINITSGKKGKQKLLQVR
jgi:hypothetical protein